jgi:hypothetical protein
MEAASPDLEKQGFFAVVFVNREYSGQPDPVEKSGRLISTINRPLSSTGTRPNPTPYLFRIELLLIKNNSILEKKLKIKYLN